MSKSHATRCGLALVAVWPVLSASLPGGSPAWAQEQSTTRQAEPARTPLPAPVGHRQPRPADIPSESRDNATAPALPRGDHLPESRLQICRQC